MEKVRLADLDLSTCIYMSIGEHVGETLEKIVERKSKEIEDCGWSLWGYSTDRKLDEFCEEHGAKYVVMTNTGKPTKNTEQQNAKHFRVNGELNEIPAGITLTYSSKSKKTHALVVEEYYFVDEQDNIFQKSKYDVPEDYIGIRDIWPLKFNSDLPHKSTDKKIMIVAKLKAPYSVEAK